MKTILLAIACALVLNSCNNGQKTDTDKGESAKAGESSGLLGAGSTFVYPLYSKMFNAYYQKNGTKVNYQSIGSGGGIKQIQERTVDFGASDAPMNDDQLSKSPGTIVHIPICLGAVVITYNLPGVTQALKFTPDVITNIYFGRITKWNDASISKLNPNVKLPDLPISVIHRSDGSGTSYVFTDYLSKVSKEWSDKVGKKTSVDWPTGLGAKGNEGVSGMVKQIPGGIGYVELTYALQNKLAVGLLQNKSGNYVDATLASVTAAGKVEIPADLRVSITNTDAADGYAISGFTYVLIYSEQSYNGRDEDKAGQLIKLIDWMLHDGQQYTEPLNFAQLPADIVNRAEVILKSVKFNGKPISI